MAKDMNYREFKQGRLATMDVSVDENGVFHYTPTPATAEFEKDHSRNIKFSGVADLNLLFRGY